MCINDIEFPIYNSIFSKNINEKSKHEIVLNNIKSGVYNLDNIQKARIINDKTSAIYSSLKENSKQITWGVDINNKLTGFVYFDIDLNSGDNKEFTRELIINIPYVCALWKSFGGNGFSGLVFCDWVNNSNDYKLAYKSLSDYFQKNIGIELDNKCSNYNRKNTLSFDSDLFLNDNPVNFDYIIQNEKIDISKLELDNNISIDIDIIEYFSDLFSKDFYHKLIVCDKLTGIPIQYSNNLIYNQSKHNLSKFISPEVISLFKSNENASLAINDNYFACIKLNLAKNLYFPHKKRAKNLIKITHKILKMNILEKDKISKNSIYSLLLVLNSRCVKYIPKNEESPTYFPLDIQEINQLTGYIFNNLNSFNIELEKCKSIRSHSFLNQWLTINNNYSGDKHPRSIIISEINRLKSLYSNSLYNDKINEIIELYPQLTNKDYIEIISLTLNLSNKRSEYLFYKFKREGAKTPLSTGTLINNVLLDEGKIAPSGKNNKDKQAFVSLSKKNDTVNKIQQEYNSLENPTQKELSEKTGYSLRTIKNYWPSIIKF